jgi:hypothetical protein
VPAADRRRLEPRDIAQPYAADWLAAQRCRGRETADRRRGHYDQLGFNLHTGRDDGERHLEVRVGNVEGVVQNSPFWGYTSERKPPAFEARLWLRSWLVREAVSLPRSSALRLNGSEAQQRQPMRMALAGHQFPWAFAGTLGNPAAYEAAMVQEEL